MYMYNKMEYTIVESMSTATLTTRVNKLITAGWQVNGSPFVYGKFIAQSLMKYDIPMARP